MKNEILRPIFWDLDVEKLDLKKNSRQIIERILEWGDLPQVHWMWENFSRKEIVEAVRNSRQLSQKSANFWANYYKIPKDEVRCLTRLLQKEQKVLWPY
jgi:hypothetical protein